jgi:hypothetical protein
LCSINSGDVGDQTHVPLLSAALEVWSLSALEK